MKTLLNKIFNLNGVILKFNEMLKEHVNFKIGGRAKYFCFVKNKKSLIKLLKMLNKNKQKYYIIGNGTNLLCSDNGFNGFVIKIGNELNKIKFKKKNVFADAGVSLFHLSKLCANKGLTGLEFSYGIPGSVGGAVKMNAGAFKGNFSDIVKYVKMFDGKKVIKLTNKQLNFSYRHSILNDNKKWVILSACLQLNYGDKNEIKKNMDKILEKRLEKQPYDKPSAGSVFKRDNKFIISKLIDELGLKGYKIGGAEISTKHAGFIVNNGNATCKDVLDLIKYIQEKIYLNYEFVPQLEVEIMGDVNDTIG